ncbi:hypothetical protein SDC9_148030 [bioreactor metagenome]|uniref:Uncharacterized protein n=1 Tax=bioreactor metagenome TaxID=1076179 RepID=A0A645EHT8_9ZZZZ
MQKEKIVLKVTGIFYIIRAALFFLACCLGVFYLMAGTVQNEWGITETADIGLYVLVILTICLAGAFDLTVGILGVRRADCPKRSVECLVLGVLTTMVEGFSLLGAVVMAFLTVQGGTGIWGMLIVEVLNAVIAVCYLVGAVQVRRSALQPAAGQWAYPMPPQV